MAEIVLQDMVKKYADLIAVDHLNLTIKNEEFLVLLGPSGCGKTTTLRCISGLEIPTEGQILIDGQEVTFKPGSERDIAFVFQLYALYPHFTVFKNIAFPLITQGVDKATIRKEVESAARLLRIENLLERKPKALAGGDQQRVALGRALVRRPKAFLLDEPIGTLDASFREEMRTELKRLHVDIGATTVYVTHDQVEAMSMGDRIAILNHGVLQQVGTPHEIYSSPKNLFVANFIGSPGMNFISCTPFKSNGDLLLNLSEIDARVHVNSNIRKIIENAGKSEAELVLGVRPENVLFSQKKQQDFIKTEVFAIEKTGSYNIVDVKLGKELLRIRTGPTVVPKVKDDVYIGFDMELVDIFDRETENSITS
jgi:multiple sugar transport system ATP-binding protein